MYSRLKHEIPGQKSMFATANSCRKCYNNDDDQVGIAAAGKAVCHLYKEGEEAGMKALILSANDFEDSELLVPYYRLLEAGYTVDVAAENRGVIRGMHGYEVQAVKGFADVDPKEYAVLILPGGKAPATVRKVQTALAIARHFITGNKPVGAICHGPQTLISAGVLHDRRATCYRTMVKELQEAGALYEDSEVVVDGRLVTSRQPADIPAFMREVMKLLSLRGVCVPDEYWGDDASIPFETATRIRM